MHKKRFIIVTCDKLNVEYVGNIVIKFIIISYKKLVEISKENAFSKWDGFSFLFVYTCR